MARGGGGGMVFLSSVAQGGSLDESVAAFWAFSARNCSLDCKAAICDQEGDTWSLESCKRQRSGSSGLTGLALLRAAFAALNWLLKSSIFAVY